MPLMFFLFDKLKCLIPVSKETPCTLQLRHPLSINSFSSFLILVNNRVTIFQKRFQNDDLKPPCRGGFKSLDLELSKNGNTRSYEKRMRSFIYQLHH